LEGTENEKEKRAGKEEKEKKRKKKEGKKKKKERHSHSPFMFRLTRLQKQRRRKVKQEKRKKGEGGWRAVSTLYYHIPFWEWQKRGKIVPGKERGKGEKGGNAPSNFHPFAFHKAFCRMKGREKEAKKKKRKKKERKLISYDLLIYRPELGKERKKVFEGGGGKKKGISFISTFSKPRRRLRPA